MAAGYKTILKQAWELSLANRPLWLWGLLLSCVSLYFGLATTPTSSTQISPWVIALFVLDLIVLVLNFRVTVALILGVRAALDKKPMLLKQDFRSSKLFYARLVSVFVLLGLIAILLALVIGVPISLVYGQNFHTRGLILSIFALIILLPVVVVGWEMLAIAPLFVVVYDLGVRDALSQSLELATAHWRRLLGWVLLLGIIDLPVLFLGQFVLELRGGLVVLILSGIGFLVLQTWFIVFQQTSWVSVFLDLIKPEEIEEEKVVPAPEPV